MKSKKIELDVDVIGGLGSLTVEEEKALSEFFKQSKKTKNKTIPKRTVKRTNMNA